ncbi:MAG: TRAP transporter small permease [Proteobacteria bacterium]|nr:TRAP transporter small permease [Pseudomonadota bacterium]
MSDVPGTDREARNRRIERMIFAIPRFIAGSLVLSLVAVTGANVVARYVFLAPFYWAEEVLSYVMIAFIYLAAILVTWDGNHLKMDILSQALKSPLKEIVNFLSTILFIAMCAFIVVQSFEVTVLQVEYGKRSVAAEVPMVIPHSMVLIGFLFMMVAVIVRFRAHVRGELGNQRDKLLEDSPGKPLDLGI